MLVIAYVPCGPEDEARRLGRMLIKERLAACANIIRSLSVYEWKGELKEEDEWIVLAKTTAKAFPALKERVEKAHSYDLPCVIGLPAGDVNEPYVNWVEERVE